MQQGDVKGLFLSLNVVYFNHHTLQEKQFNNMDF